VYLEIADAAGMSAVKAILSAITNLSLAEQRAIREWLDDLIEAQLELTDEVKAKLDQARQDIAEGRFRTSPQLEQEVTPFEGSPAGHS
jgi:hypothetical protein